MYYVGIDLGGTKIAAGLVDKQGKILAKASTSTGKERPADEIIKDMAMLAKQVIDDYGIETTSVKSIGIGCPGIVNDKDGTLIYANNIPNLSNKNLRAGIQRYINLPVILDNDANCAALAESVAGAAKDVDHSVTITLGTGIGSGVIINGRIYSGMNNAGAELGHMVIAMGGKKCNCGRSGCWEVYASATALIEQVKEAIRKNPDSLIYRLVEGDLSKINAKVAFDAAKAGDSTAVEVINRYYTYVAEGIINTVNIFCPQVVVIGGGISKQGEYLLKPIREMVNKYMLFKGNSSMEIRTAKMGNDAGIVGAAMLGRD
ncbi:MAG TPA: ROK family protein [Clostridiaceae bacterium]|nr:ROK family protein [Clostridiaceae bacterium]